MLKAESQLKDGIEQINQIFNLEESAEVLLEKAVMTLIAQIQPYVGCLVFDTGKLLF